MLFFMPGSLRSQFKKQVGRSGVDREHQQSMSDTEIRSSWRKNNDNVQLQAKNIEFTQDGTDIQTLGNNGYLFVDENRGGVERQLKIAPDKNGNLKRSFFIQGQPRDFNAEAQTWLADILVEYQRRTDLSANRRVKWILAQRGPDAVLQEISHITVDQAKRAYLQTLLTQAKPDPVLLQRVLDQARREFTNDYDLAEFLLWVNQHEHQDQKTKQAWFKATDKLISDADRNRVLMATLSQAEGNQATTLEPALQSAMNFKSDYYLVDFLIQLAKTHGITDQLRPTYLSAVRKLHSTYDQDRALKAMTDSDKQH
jgi:hypothetical protein